MKVERLAVLEERLGFVRVWRADWRMVLVLGPGPGPVVVVVVVVVAAWAAPGGRVVAIGSTGLFVYWCIYGEIKRRK